MSRPLVRVAAFAAAAVYPFALLHVLRGGCGILWTVAVVWIAALAGWFASRLYAAPLIALALTAAVLLGGGADVFKLYPVFMNATAAAVFLCSLFSKPLVQTIGETFYGALDARGVAYARKATVAWGVFMSAMTAASFATVFASDNVWAVFNGFVAYLLLGGMFLAEYICRRLCRANAR